MSGDCCACGERRRIKARGLCVKCYSRARRAGPLPPIPEDARVWAKVERSGPDGCWIWTAYRSEDGYGRVRWDGTIVNAHRVIYELLVGPISPGLHLDHLCRNRACVNPAHLEPVTPSENVRRGEPANRTHCPRGHEYSAANTRVHNGSRRCLACHRIHETNYLARRAS